MSEIKDMKILDDVVAANAAGGDCCDPCASGCTKRVGGLQSGYLALRTEPKTTESNEIGALCNGDTVQVLGGTVCGCDGRNYVLVYSPKLCAQGYVNASFICQ